MQKIAKIQVATGIWWIEVPEAQLYVLCGCPADSVKFLMRRGLIVTREERGVRFETGPNAILLSDRLLQNGSFANLAEFPVLQMLYRQGMALPGHPNNTGARPLLIGSKDQVQAQMQYIFRGNYGLASVDEMIEAGVSPDEAEELMKVKLNFAFGRIVSSEDLLEARPLENDPVEIRAGVLVRRLGLNQFEFQYQGETAQVDLNLAPYEEYPVTYALGFHQLRREYFAIVHAGEGDGWDHNRPCASSIVMFQGKIYLVDAGPGFLQCMTSLGIGVNEVEGIFHTHAHDDHFAGLPALMRADHRVKYFATPLVRASVARKLAALTLIEEEDFAEYFEVHDVTPGVWNDIEGLEVLPLLSPHPVETNIFVFRAAWGDGCHSYAHFVDIAAFDVLERMVTKAPARTSLPRAWFDRIKQQYLQPAQIKKIDIGRGLIHGNAEDFRHDASAKIILCHTSAPLTSDLREIGSGAPFGTVDVLIAAGCDFLRQRAARYLQAYFPGVPWHQFEVLLNHPLVSFNPETIIFKNQTPHEFIYLVLTGVVEVIQSAAGQRHLLSAGALLGESTGLSQAPASGTHRAASFVNALQLPAGLYREFMARNQLDATWRHLHERRDFLQRSWLLGDEISNPLQNRLAQDLQRLEFPAGHLLSLQKNAAIYLVQSGTMERRLDSKVLEVLGPGQFVGEEGVLFDIPSLFQVRAATPVVVFQLDGNALLEIPAARWKLIETYERRMGQLLAEEPFDTPIFCWRKEYSVNIREMDHQHRQFFDRANRFYEAVQAPAGEDLRRETFQSLASYAEFHFQAEEVLMRRHRYPRLAAHRKRHETLLKDLLEFQEQLQGGKTRRTPLECLSFLKHWLINHLLTEDLKYAKFLNKKGVY